MPLNSKPDGPLLELKGLTKRFPGVIALNAVDLSLAPGEIHALVGENGAGKSTLIKLTIRNRRSTLSKQAFG